MSLFENQNRMLEQINAANEVLGSASYSWNNQIATLAKQATGIANALATAVAKPAWQSQVVSVAQSVGRLASTLEVVQNNWGNGLNNLLESIENIIPSYSDELSRMYRAIEKLDIKAEEIIHAINNSRPNVASLAAAIEELASIDISDFENAEFDDVIIAEFEQDIASLELETENWEQRAAAPVKKWADKHPVLAFILLFIILPYIINSAPSPKSNATTKCDTLLREQPDTTSSTIIVVPENSTIIISEEAPYWIKIEYTQEEQEDEVEPITGWMSKRSIKLKEREKERQ